MAGEHKSKRSSARSLRWLHPVALARGLLIHTKLYWSLFSALIALLLAPDWLSASARAALAWDVAAIVYIVLAFGLFSRCGNVEIQDRATKEDETRFVFYALILLAVIAGLTAVVGLIGEARSLTGTFKGTYLLLAGVAIVSSWMILQIIFTLHYAHEYYRPPPEDAEAASGLKFPDPSPPDYWDFFYFTTSIGATSQTSDVTITSKAFRRLVAFQAILSFIFNTTVVAFAINLAASLIQT